MEEENQNHVMKVDIVSYLGYLLQKIQSLGLDDRHPYDWDYFQWTGYLSSAKDIQVLVEEEEIGLLKWIGWNNLWY